MQFAYLDENGVLHINPDKGVAEAEAQLNHKVVETDQAASSEGYPLDAGDKIFVYAVEHIIYRGGNARTGKPVEFTSLERGTQELLTAVGYTA
jgi:hypothetical protein